MRKVSDGTEPHAEGSHPSAALCSLTHAFLGGTSGSQSPPEDMSLGNVRTDKNKQRITSLPALVSLECRRKKKGRERTHVNGGLSLMRPNGTNRAK